MLVLCDLDKTLIDESYGITDSAIHEAIARAIARGHVVGLNSDTPLPPLQRWHRDFGMNGPIIAEGGALMWRPDTQEIRAAGTAPEGAFPDLRDRILRHFTSGGVVEAIMGDPATIIRERRFRIVGDPREVILASALRRFSLHLMPVQITGGGYLSAMDLLERIHLCVVQMLEDTPLPCEVSWDLNREYGLLILHAAATCKQAGVSALLPWLGEREAIMIGDSINDHIDLPSVQQWAVANASGVYRAVCSRIAEGSYSTGVVELLDSLS